MKKRLLFLVTLLLTGAILGQLNAQTISGTDVTSTYLTNPGFESCDVTTSNAAAGSSAAPIAINGEWTQSSSAQWSSSAVVAYGGTGQVNGVSAPSADNAGNSGNTLGVSVGWSGSVSYQSSSFTLPAGSYVIKVNGYNALSGVTQFKSLFGFIPTSGTSMMSTKTQFAYGTWETDEIQLTLAQDTEGKIQIGGQAVSGGSGANAKVFFDNIVILFNDPALASKLIELQGVLKKAKAINGVWGNDDLTTLITTVEGKTYSSVADMNTDIEAIKAYYESLETVTLNNGDFNTDVNIALDGTNSASFIAPATAAKPYIYPVTGWTQNFKFSSTAAQGNTAVYGATISGDNGTNGTNPPTADMFGKTEGGTLHLSSGWSDQARYNQVLTNLQPGKYIVYYEANNQNSGATTINSNYFGLGDIEAGNLGTNNNTFVYSDLKTYPYNEWVASATGFNLIAPEESATLNVGVVGTTGISANGAKLWVDNVTIYYLGWDATEALTTLQDLVDTADELLAKQMNQDFKAPLATAKANAETVIDSSTDYDEISAAQLALSTAVNNAQASVAQYEQISAYLGKLTAESQRGGLTEAQVKAMPFYTKYSDGMVNETADNTTGTYTSLDEVLPLYKANIAEYWAENVTDNADLTAYVVNNSFEFGDMTSWANYVDGDSGVRENSNGTYTMSNVDGSYLFNTWNNNTANKYVFQDVANLPNGTYQITATFGSDADNTINLTAQSGSNEQAEIFTTGSAKTEGVEKTVTVVVNNGNLRLGANCNTWFKVDNFRLTYLGNEIPASLKPEIPSGPMNKDVLAALTAASDAFDATGGNTVENYNALLTAISNANASIGIYQQINAVIPKLEAQKGSVNVDALTTDYNSGEYVVLNDVYTKYHNIVKDALANPADNTDMTPFIINPSFEFGDGTGWTFTSFNDSGVKSATEGTTYPYSGTVGSYLFNTWSNTTTQTVNLSQTLSDLPNGTYKLTAVLSGYASRDITMTAGTKSSVTTTTENGSADGVNGELTFVVSNGQITFRVEAVQFFKADNFQLTFLSSDVTQEFIDEVNDAIEEIDTSKHMNADEKAQYVAALEAWNAAEGHTPENYQKLLDLAPIVKASIAAYEKAAVSLAKIPNFITSTNVYTFDAYNTFYTAYNRYKSMYDNGGLKDNTASSLDELVFGSGKYHENPVPVVPFLGSAWDDYGDYTWTGNTELGTSYTDNYWVNTWSAEYDCDDFARPYIEYYTANGNSLTSKTMTASIKGTAEAEYKATVIVRVRTNDGAVPTGITFRMAAEDNNNEMTYYPATITWTKMDEINGDDNFYLANIEVIGYSDYDSDGDGYGDARIQFVVDEENNVSWLAFKNANIKFNGTMQKSTIDALKEQMEEQVALAKTHKLGFDWKGDEFGTTEDEYAPYANARQLKAMEYCENYLSSLYALDEKLQNNEITEDEYIAEIPTFLLMKQALTGLQDANTSWTANTYEMNGFFWNSNYTAEQIELVQFYDDEGNPAGTFRTLYPAGWDLDGRSDAYNTRIFKYGVNQNEPGLKAISDKTGLFVKYNTNYGDETGFTLPLKGGVEYSLTFIYADWGDNHKCVKTDITILNRDTREDVTEQLVAKGWTGEATSFRPKEGDGESNMDHWYYYRAHFTPQNDGDYVIFFTKDREDRRQKGFQGYLTEQLQVVLGDLVLVRAPQETDTYVINGEDKTTDYTPTTFDANHAIVTRNFNYNGTEGTWNTLCLPFNLDAYELEYYFNIPECAYFMGTDETSEGYMLRFETRKAGIKANQPVMVWKQADTDDDKTDLNEVKVYDIVIVPLQNTRTIEDKEYPVVDEGDYFDFVGTYQRIKIPQHCVFVNATNQWKRSSGNNGLSPTRGYFFDKTGGEASAKLLGFSVDEVATGIMAIEEDGSMHVTSGNIYTVDGRLVRQNATSLEGLQPGIYVVDGKKYIIK